jgi:hypothetical protein
VISAQPARLRGGSTARLAYAWARCTTTEASSSFAVSGTNFAILFAITSRALAAAAAALISESWAVIYEITPGRCYARVGERGSPLVRTRTT